MVEECVYKGRVPYEVSTCNSCSLFSDTCLPIAGADGYSFGECDCFLCEGCTVNCIYKALINL